MDIKANYRCMCGKVCDGPETVGTMENQTRKLSIYISIRRGIDCWVKGRRTYAFQKTLFCSVSDNLTIVFVLMPWIHVVFPMLPVFIVV